MWHYDAISLTSITVPVPVQNRLNVANLRCRLQAVRISLNQSHLKSENVTANKANKIKNSNRKVFVRIIMKETKSMDIVDFAQVKLNMLYSISYKKDESNQLESCC